MAMLFYVGLRDIGPYTVSCYVSGLLADQFPKHCRFIESAIASGHSRCGAAGARQRSREVRGRVRILRAVHGRLGDARKRNRGYHRSAQLGFGLLATVNGACREICSPASSSAFYGLKVSPAAAGMTFVIVTWQAEAMMAEGGQRVRDKLNKSRGSARPQTLSTWASWRWARPLGGVLRWEIGNFVGSLIALRVSLRDIFCGTSRAACFWAGS